MHTAAVSVSIWPMTRRTKFATLSAKMMFEKTTDWLWQEMVDAL